MSDRGSTCCDRLAGGSARVGGSRDHSESSRGNGAGVGGVNSNLYSDHDGTGSRQSQNGEPAVLASDRAMDSLTESVTYLFCESCNFGCVNWSAESLVSVFEVSTFERTVSLNALAGKMLPQSFPVSPKLRYTHLWIMVCVS